MTLQIIAALAVIAVAIIYFVRRQLSKPPTPDTSTRRPDKSLWPVRKIANDKLVLITGAGYEDLRKVATGFCNMYNKDSYGAVMQLFDLPDGTLLSAFHTILILTCSASW